MAGVDDPRVISFFGEALPVVMARHIQLEQHHRVSKKRTVLWTTLLIFFDTVSDYGAYAVLAIDDSSYATPMLVVLILSVMCQALVARFVSKQGPIAVVGGLLGVKPILDGIYIIFDVPPDPGAADVNAALSYTRLAATSTESIPFAVIQALALMEHRSIAQWLSFAITVANVANSVASVDCSFDKSSHFRKVEPLCYGAYAHGPKGDALFAFIALFALGYVTAKLIAVAMLGTASSVSLGLMMVGESILLLLVRVALGNWRLFVPAGDNNAISLVFHFFAAYPLLLAAPIPVIRQPFFLSPTIYAAFITWTLFVANPFMLVLASFHNDGPTAAFDSNSVWIVWGISSALSVLSSLIAFVLMEPAYRGTFYRHRTFATHVREFHWVRSTKFDGTLVASNRDLDEIRASLFQKYAKVYLPMDLAGHWVREGWAEWLREPPAWFTEAWRAHVSVGEWLSGNNHADECAEIIPQTVQEATFREKIGRASPWDLSARELEAFLEQRFVNSADLPSGTRSETTKRRQLVHQIAAFGGFGILERCCTSDTQSPWVRIARTASGEPLRDDETRLLLSVLCKAGLIFYYQLYVASVSHSPLHGYSFVHTIDQRPHYDLTLVRNRETERLDLLTLTSVDKLQATQMARDKKNLSNIQKAGDISEFVSTIYHWGGGAHGAAVFIIGEYSLGGRLVERINANIGIENCEEFWRLAFQLSQGMAAIHRTELTHMNIRAQNAMLTKDGDVRYCHIGLQRCNDASETQVEVSDHIPGPATDVHRIAVLLYRMSSGQQMPHGLSNDDVLATIPDPLKRELILRSLLVASKPSADELTQIISKLAPFDVRKFSDQATRTLLEVEHRAKAAAEEDARQSEKLRAVVPCVMICDPGNGVGCESALVILRTLNDLGHIKPLGVIANLWPSGERARLLRGTLDILGMHDVPVGIGSNGGLHEHVHEWESAQSYVTPPKSERMGTVVTSHRLLKLVFEDAAPASITLLCTSSLKDAAIFLRDSEAMFVQKIRTVVLVGDVTTAGLQSGGVAMSHQKQTDELLEFDQDQHEREISFIPKQLANADDTAAAHFFYRQCQLLGVPLIIVNDEAAQIVSIPSSFYDTLADIKGSPIGPRLREVNRAVAQKAWQSACEFDNHKRHFCDTFCGGLGLDRGKNDSVWDLVATPASAELIALISCVPVLAKRFVVPEVHVVQPQDAGSEEVKHQLVGATATTHSTSPLRQFLFDALRTGVTASRVKTAASPLVMITDAGQDLDDEMAMVLVRSLQDKGLVDLKGAVANLAPSRARARLVRGTLVELGLGAVPVATGTDGGFTKYIPSFEETARDYIVPDDATFDHTCGIDLLNQLYETAAENSLELLCISSLKDAAEFLRAHEQLFLSKTKAVTIMGGVMPFDQNADDELLVPDTAHNNTFDKEASDFFYRRCQEIRVPLIIVSRHAAMQCPMPRSIYDDMAQTGHPIGKRLRDVQRPSIEALWKRACSPEGPGRIGLPPRCDKSWFCATFCSGQGGDRTIDDSVWDLVASFIMRVAQYDPVALVCALPSKRYLFNPTVKTVHGVCHLVVGTDAQNHGVHVSMIEELQDFMYTSFFEGVTLDYAEFTKTVAVANESDELGRRRLAENERTIRRAGPPSLRQTAKAVTAAIRLKNT